MLDEIYAQRFWTKVEMLGPEECWLWLGQKNTKGYGVFWARRGMRATHVSLELDGRPRQDNLHALHSCDNPQCVNPKHLRWGTISDNAKDAASKGRLNSQNGQVKFCQGSAHGMSKLIETDIPIIRRLLSEGHSLASIGRKFKVDPTMIGFIRDGRNWRHV